MRFPLSIVVFLNVFRNALLTSSARRRADKILLPPLRSERTRGPRFLVAVRECQLPPGAPLAVRKPDGIVPPTILGAETLTTYPIHIIHPLCARSSLPSRASSFGEATKKREPELTLSPFGLRKKLPLPPRVRRPPSHPRRLHPPRSSRNAVLYSPFAFVG